QSLLVVSWPSATAPFFAPLAMLFFLAFAIGQRFWAAVFFAMLLALREDMGFHIFGLILLLVVYERVIEKASWEKLRGLGFYGFIGFAYSVVCVLAQHYFLLGGDLRGGELTWVYLGHPPYAHVTRDWMLNRLTTLINHRLDLVLGVAATVALAYFC